MGKININTLSIDEIMELSDTGEDKDLMNQRELNYENEFKAPVIHKPLGINRGLTKSLKKILVKDKIHFKK